MNGGIPRVFSPPVSFADQLTVARAAVVPLVVLLYVWDFPGHDYWATALFAVAMATDWFDGRLARRSGRTSALGSLLDPVADKLLVLTVMIVLVGPRRLRGLDGGGDRRPRAPRSRGSASRRSNAASCSKRVISAA